MVNCSKKGRLVVCRQFINAIRRSHQSRFQAFETDQGAASVTAGDVSALGHTELDGSDYIDTGTGGSPFFEWVY
jgi:hypothetical protein